MIVIHENCIPCICDMTVTCQWPDVTDSPHTPYTLALAHRTSTNCVTGLWWTVVHALQPPTLDHPACIQPRGVALRRPSFDSADRLKTAIRFACAL